MTDKVIIRVKGCSQDSGVVENVCEGKYRQVSEAEYLKYDEYLDGESGVDACISNMIKLTKNEVVVIKKGAISSHMTFVSGKTTNTIYKTPFGSMPMEVHTKSVKVIRTNNRLRILMDYVLTISSGGQIENSMDISVESL